MKDIYLILSSTDGHMGSFIRKITHMTYNHVSFSFDNDLSDMISFARYYYRAPFYGGFIHEGVQRYKKASILLYQISIEDDSYKKIHQLITEMDENSNDYIYHMINAALSPFHRSIYIEKAHTCVSFANLILQQSDLPFESSYDIKMLMDQLKPYLINQGPMDAFQLQSDSAYLKPLNFVDVFKLTLIQNLRLLHRLFFKSSKEKDNIRDSNHTR